LTAFLVGVNSLDNQLEKHRCPECGCVYKYVKPLSLPPQPVEKMHGKADLDRFSMFSRHRMDFQGDPNAAHHH
jgi:hypothetical protein